MHIQVLIFLFASGSVCLCMSVLSAFISLEDVTGHGLGRIWDSEGAITFGTWEEDP
jgi:hypothetical protein